MTASSLSTILTSSTLAPYSTHSAYCSGSLQQNAFPLKSPDKMPKLDHQRAKPPLRLPSIRCTGNQLPSLNKHTGPSSVLAASILQSFGLYLALFTSFSCVNLQTAFILDAGISLGSSLRFLRLGKVTSAIQICSACALPDECVAQRHLQIVSWKFSCLKGSHWKVNEGHLSL